MKKSNEFWQEVKNAAGKGLACPEYKIRINVDNNYYELNKEIFKLLEDLEELIFDAKAYHEGFEDLLIHIDFYLHQMKHHYLELEFQNNSSSEELKNKLLESRKDLIGRATDYAIK